MFDLTLRIISTGGEIKRSILQCFTQMHLHHHDRKGSFLEVSNLSGIISEILKSFLLIGLNLRHHCCVGELTFSRQFLKL